MACDLCCCSIVEGFPRVVLAATQKYHITNVLLLYFWITLVKLLWFIMMYTKRDKFVTVIFITDVLVSLH